MDDAMARAKAVYDDKSRLSTLLAPLQHGAPTMRIGDGRSAEAIQVGNDQVISIVRERSGLVKIIFTDERYKNADNAWGAMLMGELSRENGLCLIAALAEAFQ
jgi:hypothetical protein